MEQPRPASPSKPILRFFSRTSNSIIVAGATIIAALITALGVSKHEDRTQKTELAQVEAAHSERIQENLKLKAELATKQQRIDQLEYQLRTAVTRTSGLAPSENTSPAPASSIAQQRTASTQEAAGFMLKLEGCRRSGTTVTCDIILTNNESERKVWIYAWGYENASRAVDEHGEHYYVSQGKLGSETDDQPTAIASTGVPLKGWLRVREVPPNSRTFRLLQIWMSTGNSFKFDFHDVPIAA